MAGAFPDVPGFRFEYDRDGSVVIGSGATLSTGQMQTINNEYADDVNMGTGDVAFAWPEVRTVTGIFIKAKHGVYYPDHADVYTSVDTTNGSDGTWVYTGKKQPENVYPSPGSADGLIPTWCRTIVPFDTEGGICVWSPALTNIKGLKFSIVYRGGFQVQAFHIYGQIPLTSNPSRLVLCDTSGTPTTNGAYFDFGNAARSTTDSIPFRIKNNSASSTAQSITVSMETLYGYAAGSFIADHDFSFGGAWVKSQNIGDLAPGAITPVYQFRRNTPATAAVGPWQGRVLAIPAFMT